MDTPRERPIAFEPEVAEILLWIGMRGLVGIGDLTQRWTTEVVSPMIGKGFIQVDGEFAFLTPAGDAHLTFSLRERAAEDIHTLDAFFGQFEEMDARFKIIATDWQRLRSHVDDDPDALMNILEQWMELDRKIHDAVAASPVAWRLLAAYLPLLADARSAFDEGDWDSFTGVGENSYHSTWYAMHEVLLRAAGRERST